MTREILEGRKDEVADKVLELGQTAAANYFDIPRSTLRDFLQDNNLPTTKNSTVTLKPNEAEVESTEYSDPEQIVIEAGLDPKDWEFKGVVINRWGQSGEEQKQTKVNLVRKGSGELIQAARPDGPKFNKPVNNLENSDYHAFVWGDQQFPYIDRKLEEKAFEHLADAQPKLILNIGDTMDLPTVSKYKAQPERDRAASLQQTVNQSYDHIKTQREICPDATIVKIIGNHDVRLRDIIIALTPELYGLKRAEVEGVIEAPVMSIEHLLRLDELGVEVIGDYDAYEHGEYKLSNYLAARHGFMATKGAGVSAAKTIETLGYSCLIGHTHRQAIIHKTMHDINGELKVLTGVETGAMCVVDRTGLGHSPNPDWQNGYATVDVFDDGRFNVDLAKYVKGNLYWRGSRY